MKIAIANLYRSASRTVAMLPAQLTSPGSSIVAHCTALYSIVLFCAVVLHTALGGVYTTEFAPLRCPEMHTKEMFLCCNHKIMAENKYFQLIGIVKIFDILTI